MAVTLKATLRNDLRRSVTKQLREAGQLPAIVYGKEKEPKAVSVDQIDLIKTIRDAGRNAIISLDVEGDNSYQVMLHEYQMDPIKQELVHADFYEVDLSEEISVSVPVRVDGEVSVGIIQQLQFELQVKAKPHQIPDEIVVDVSNLEIGDSITVAELPKSDQYKYETDADTTVVTVLPPETTDDVEEESAAEESEQSEAADESEE